MKRSNSDVSSNNETGKTESNMYKKILSSVSNSTEYQQIILESEKRISIEIAIRDNNKIALVGSRLESLKKLTTRILNMKQDEHCTFVTENGMCPSHLTQFEDLQLFMLEDEEEAKQLKNRFTLRKGWMRYCYDTNNCRRWGSFCELEDCQQFIGDNYNPIGKEESGKDIRIDSDWPDIRETILKTDRAHELTDPENKDYALIVVECTIVSLKPEMTSNQ